MHEIRAMSKIASLTFKSKNIDIYMREKLGKHRAPYIVAILADGSEAHFTTKDLEIFDCSIKNKTILNYIKKWIEEYQRELLVSWKSIKTCKKATKVPTSIPKQVKGFLVKRINHLEVIEGLKMMLWFDGDTEARIVDFAKIITKNSALHELKDPKVLKKAKIFGTALRWEDQDLDIEAADLYEVSFPVETKVTAFINKVARYIRPLDGTPSNSSID